MITDISISVACDNPKCRDVVYPDIYPNSPVAPLEQLNQGLTKRGWFTVGNRHYCRIEHIPPVQQVDEGQLASLQLDK